LTTGRQEFTEKEGLGAIDSLPGSLWSYDLFGPDQSLSIPLWKSRAIGEKTLVLEHPGLAIEINNLASLYTNQGKYEQAEPLLQRAFAIYKKTFGPHHPYTKSIQENYARFLEEKQQKRR
jgi:tetratricopeptide (TPR) repeat protein